MYRFMLMLLISALLGGQPAEAGAEKWGSIEGFVQIKGSQTAVAGAKILLKPTGSKTETDQAGEFIFEKLSPGEYQIVVSLEGFEPVSLTVKVKSGLVKKVVIEMSASKKDKDESSRYNRSVDQTLQSAISSEEKLKRDQSKSTGKSADRSVTIGLPSPVAGDDIKQMGDISLNSVNGLTAKPRVRPSSEPQPQPQAQRMMPFERPDLYGRPKPILEQEFGQPRDMFFKNYGVNRFVFTRNDQFSTFALDVDDGSYNIVKEYLLRGSMPPADAIRVEEFINHFDYGYANPRRKTFRLFTELTSSPFDRDVSLLKLAVKGKEMSDFERLPLNLTFVIDVSGSMRQGNRLGLVKESIRLLLQQLDGRDRVGLVAYGSNAWVILEPTSAMNNQAIIKALAQLQAGGSTYAEAGLKLGYRMANRSFASHQTNRVILCSDGVANVGQTSPEAIMADISEYAQRGITLSTFGYGMGNYNDLLLEQLAIKGDGGYAYVNDLKEAKKLFVAEFIDNMALLARDAKIQVQFDPGVVESYRLLGYENRAVADNRFRDNSADGGEIGPGHEVTALYEIKFHAGRHNRRVNRSALGTVALRWIEPDESEVTELSQAISSTKSAHKFGSARAELRLAVVGSRFAEILKRTAYVGTASYAQLLSLATEVDRDLGTEQSSELVDLIRRASYLDSFRAEW